MMYKKLTINGTEYDRWNIDWYELLNGKDSRIEQGAEINRQWRRAVCRQPKAKGIIRLLNKIFCVRKKKILFSPN